MNDNDDEDPDTIRRQMMGNSTTLVRQVSTKFGRGNANTNTKEVELHGVLEKRNRNGIYQKRYFQTERSLLKYWSSENDTGNVPSSVYDVRDVRLIHSVAADQLIHIQFSNDKFKLDLRAISEEQCEEWSDFLKAKTSLYSMDNLLSCIDEGLSFRTRTFESLLRIPVSDQDQWVNNILNDSFETILDLHSTSSKAPTKTSKLSIHRAILAAARSCLTAFSNTCKDCALEMDARDPKIMAHCRDFMHRYAVGFMSRITLELSTYLGHSCLEEVVNLGDDFLIECLRFVYTIDSIKHYQFLPRSMFRNLRENLLSFDDISDAFGSLLLDRNEAIFEELNELQPRQRGKKLSEYYKIVAFQVDTMNASFYIEELSVVEKNDKIAFIVKAVETMIHSLLNYVRENDFYNYGEEGLIEHILACQVNIKKLGGLRVYPYARYNDDGLLVDTTVCRKWYVAISNDVMEELGMVFTTSADKALEKAVKNLSRSCDELVSMFLIEKQDVGWIGGKLIKAYLNRVSTWLNDFCLRGSASPCEFHRISTREVIRLIVVTYMKKTIDTYFNDKKFKLSEEGVLQVASDLQQIISWVDNRHAALTPPGVNTSDFTGLNDVSMLLRSTRMLLMSDEDNLLLCFSESIQHFGHKSIIHMYDLSRLILKVREDMSLKQRKHMLAVFSYYVEQFTSTTTEVFEPLGKPHPRLSGPAILSELFPLAGEVHCTGTKWHYEQLPKSYTKVKFDIMTLVTDAMSLCRERRRVVGMDNLSEVTSKRKNFIRGREVMGQDFEVVENSKKSHTPLNSGNFPTIPEDSEVNVESIVVKVDESNTIRTDDKKKDDTEEWLLLRESFVHPNSNCSLNTRFSELLGDGGGGRPFIDLYGVDFEELHVELRPPVYHNTYIPPVQFISLQHRYWLRPREMKEKDHQIEYLREENKKLKVEQLKSDEATKLQAELEAARAEMELMKQSLIEHATETSKLKQEQTIAATIKMELDQIAVRARAQIENESAHTVQLLQAKLEAAELAVKINEETVVSLKSEETALSEKILLNKEICDNFDHRILAAESDLLIQQSLLEQAMAKPQQNDDNDIAIKQMSSEVTSLKDQIILMKSEKGSTKGSVRSFEREKSELFDIIGEAKAQLKQKINVANSIKKDQEILNQEMVIKAEREIKIQKRVAAEELRLKAEKREQLIREAAEKAERIREEEFRVAVALREAENAKAIEELRITQGKQRVADEISRKKAEQKAALAARIEEEENLFATTILRMFDMEVIGEFTMPLVEQAVQEYKDEVELSTASARLGVKTNSEKAAYFARVKQQEVEEEEHQRKVAQDEKRRLEANYEVVVIRHLGTTAELFFIEAQKECIYACWSLLRDGIKVNKFSKGEGGSNERYLHIDLSWTKLYWRNKLSREDEKKASRKTSIFGKSYGDREFLLSDVTSLKTHDKMPNTLEFQCDKNKRSYVFEINPSHFDLLQTALHLVLDFMKYHST